jgi:hypothetical protein
LILAIIAISFTILQGLKYIIAILSNNTANEICEKLLEICKQPYRYPNIVYWLIPTNEQAILNNMRALGILEVMA